ncbi:Leucine carboxyl methyltransferase 2 [Dimargaris verticillata]|uniref:tRNA wybutosine-synthesizing protein 4 n=1 Tax=Dimargaris verticillata TaxID=2761393 RepID=A0A9W8B522_9FUNG|nr:Leucine carboxyl methyltransferase 2 [Dimargaris verticillata]
MGTLANSRREQPERKTLQPCKASSATDLAVQGVWFGLRYPASTGFDETLPTGLQLMPAVPCNLGGRATTLGTNDNSIVSKRSADCIGYFREQQFLRHFVARKKSRRAPVINLGYFARSVVVDYFTSWHLNVPMSTITQDQQVVSAEISPVLPLEAAPTPPSRRKLIVLLGCGFDPSYFRMRARLIAQSYAYVEVDFPDLVQRKSRIIQQDPELQAMLATRHPEYQSNGNIVADDYYLIGSDLKYPDRLSQAFSDVGLDPTDEMLFISEVALVYMDPTDADQVIRWASHFPCARFVLYEQTIPTAQMNPFGQTMLLHFDKMRSTLKGTHMYPRVADQVARFRRQGWPFVAACELGQLWHALLPSTERQRIHALEPFDEWEEWHMKSAHYLVLFAESRAAHRASTVLSKSPDRLLRYDFISQWQPSVSTPLSPLPTTQLLRQASRQSLCNVRTCALSKVGQAFAKGMWHTLADSAMQVHRWGLTATALSNTGVMVFGGYGLPSNPEPNSFHQRLASPLLVPWSWMDGNTCSHSDISITASMSGTIPSPRLYHAAHRWGEANGIIFGGRASPTAALGDAFCFCKVAGQWQWSPLPLIPKNGVADGVPLPASSCLARYRHASCIISDPSNAHGSTMVVHGGVNSQRVTLDDMFVVDISSGQWSSIRLQPYGGQPQHLPAPRHSHSLTFIPASNRIWMVGGLLVDGTSDSGVFCIEPATWVCERVPLTYTPSEHVPLVDNCHVSTWSYLGRYSHQATPVPWCPHLILVVGGITPDTVLDWSTAWMLLDTDARSWCYLPMPHPLDTPTAWLLVGHQLVWKPTNDCDSQTISASDAELLVVGGGATCFSFGTHFNRNWVQFRIPCGAI